MLKQSRLRRFVSRSLTFVAAPLFLLPIALAQATARVTLPVLSPSALAHAADAGPVPVAQTLTLTVTLASTPAQDAALTKFLSSVTDASSSDFHQWLTPGQFAGRYGASADQLAAASAWAQAQGLSVAAVSPAGTRMTLKGTAAQVQAAFGVSIDLYRQNGFVYFANGNQPSLPAPVAGLFVSIDGLNDLPGDLKTAVSGPTAAPATLVDGRPSLEDVATLGALIDANETAILSLDATFGTGSLTSAQLTAYSVLFRQAAAQGITTLVHRTAVSQGFPDGLPEVTALALPNDSPDASLPFAGRPQWQAAPGLPADSLRHTPDLVASSLSAFAAALAQIAGGDRLGNIDAALYAIAPTPGLYTQPDAAPAGTWEPAEGLGLVDLKILASAFPRGTGSSFTSFQATNYSPIHGQGTSFTSSVTSGTGGPQPTGSVSFVSSTGAVLGTSPLVNGTGSITLTNLGGGNLTVDAVYSGDAVYASSTSPMAQLYVQPEPSQLSATIGGTPTIGGSYTVTVTDATTSGQPAGPISVAISGTTSVYTAALVPAGPNNSTATVTIPATTAGTLTLSITCVGSANYSCSNPLTTTVTIAKATPPISISYSPNPPVSGAGIALNAVVGTVGNAPAPTGAVTFFDNGTILNTGQLSNGTTSATGTVPSTATHAISATYAGDPNYLSVSTGSGAGTGGSIATALALASSSATVSSGKSITLTATLTPAGSGPAGATGSVTFFDAGAQIGTANLAGNVAAFTTSSLSATSNHILTAVYSGDGNYAGSTSNGVGLTPGNNTGATTSTTLVATPGNPIHGQKVTLTATVTPPAGGAAVTGTVNFTSSQTGLLGQATIANGVATLSTTQLPGGASTLTAAFNGSSTYNPSFSSATTLTVAPEPVQLSIAVPATATFGTAFPVTVLVTGASGVSYPTGTVTVQPQGTGYAAASTAAVTSGGAGSTGSALVNIPATGAGSVSFTATYAGDNNFAAAGPVSTTAAIARVTSPVTLSFSPSRPVANQPTTLIVKVAFASAIAPTGPVHFYEDGTIVGNVLLDATGTASVTVTLTAGDHAIYGLYKGDADYAPTTSLTANTTTGNVPTSTTVSVNPQTVTLGSPVTLSSTVGPTTNGIAPTGTVQFSSGASVVCTANLANGAASCTFTPTALGSSSITAFYSGDSTYNISYSPAATLTVAAGAGSLAATISPASGPGGSMSTVTATVAAPAGMVPTGTVTATVTNAASTINLSTSSAVLPGSGTASSASVTIPVAVPLAAGSYNVVVACVNTNFSCSNVNLALASTGSSTAGTKIVTSTTLTSSPATLPASGVVSLTATILAASAGSAAPSGAVVFYDGTTPIATALLTAGSVATASATLSVSATHSITAVYGGDTNYAGSTSAALSLAPTATPSPAVITLTANTTSGLAGSNVVLTASVAGQTAAGASPTGKVSFYVSGTSPGLLGTATLATTGAGVATATLIVANIPAGGQTVYAVYAGNTNFASATSNLVSFGFTDFSLSFVPQTLTLTPGQTGQATALLNMINGFTGMVAFGCTPPPDTSITCSFSPTTLTGGGSTTLTISTVAPKAAPSQHAGLKVVGGLSFAALLCLLLPMRRRRLPALLAVLLALALTANVGCSDGTFVSSGIAGGTPLGTALVNVTAVGTNAGSTVRHNYTFQVTVQ